MTQTHRTHRKGPGLTILSTATWYGGGYCGICGHRDTDSRDSPLIPQQVRFWDADDGWKVGVLCSGCGEDAAARGPRKGDYAYINRGEQAMKQDILAEFGDEDVTYTEGNDD